jgi:hypothetical protein
MKLGLQIRVMPAVATLEAKR